MSQDQQPSRPRNGRIITFYSYKGGTGRSMALANVAWILASQRNRVLVIDWDLEAPGLHRYYYPFLDDTELADSPGLIDYFTDFGAAARTEARESTNLNSGQEPWWSSWTSLLRYTYRLNWNFDEAPSNSPSDTGAAGAIDFVPAGRQDGDYANRVHAFDWKGFYERLGGGILLEAVKRRLRERYDYVLIDSRTGISDTSGVCTVQMPDELVVCFTFNQQSIKGAAAVAASAEGQRRLPNGRPGLRVWPVATRVEMAEKERLELARDNARATFQRYLRHMTRIERASYWGRIEVLYQPYFAYEEVLAVFGERRRQTSSMLASYEFLASYISSGAVQELGEMSETRRQATLPQFVRSRTQILPFSTGSRSPGLIFVSYTKEMQAHRQALADALRTKEIQSWSDIDIQLGEDRQAAITNALNACIAMVVLIGASGVGDLSQGEIAEFLRNGKRVIPVLIGAPTFALPDSIKTIHAASLPEQPSTADWQELSVAVSNALLRAEPTTIATDPDDPQKRRWGGSPTRDGYELLASVQTDGEGWFNIVLTVSGRKPTSPLIGNVVFHLHPTFEPSTVKVVAEAGRAILSLSAWGAFTVGAEVNGGSTILELDLALDSSFPQAFRDR